MSVHTDGWSMNTNMCMTNTTSTSTMNRLSQVSNIPIDIPISRRPILILTIRMLTISMITEQISSGSYHHAESGAHPCHFLKRTWIFRTDSRWVAVELC